MKIAIVLRELLMSGGGERQGIMLARELRERGHDVTIYSSAFDPKRCFPEETSSLPIKALPIEELQRIRTKKFFLPQTLAVGARESELARAVARLIPVSTEVINPNDNWGMRAAYYFKRYAHDSLVYTKDKRPKKPVSVVMLNDVDTARWTLFNDPLFKQPQKGPFKYFLSWLKDYAQFHFVRAQDTIVVLSDRTGGLVKKYFGREAVTVRSGVDHERFKFVPRKFPGEGKPLRLLSHGIFYIHRRYEDTIRAVDLLRKKGIDARLVIIGDYTHKAPAKKYFDSLQGLVQELKLESVVTFSGRVSDAELLQSFYDADAFVSAAHMQTWGLAPFEALATGLPAVVSTTIGASEILEEGKTAIKFEPGNPESQAMAIEGLFESREVYERLSRDGNAFVRGRLSWKRYADDMLALFERARTGRRKSE